jgi:hypothetical protein
MLALSLIKNIDIDSQLFEEIIQLHQLYKDLNTKFVFLLKEILNHAGETPLDTITKSI